ncbi:lytic transglycosylase domain-containing protein [Microvirga lotononidis]|uniref:Soluble lytic murein transglycosylase-like protein n=1 Tax=Microvirga lotononidis TaxID=864069 RepID=I4YVF8_9HYPH|nr:lytic transglycosylase domain-containing protein [Microvirga lotononidis]EIM27950.1 soluble lytic murein transglycosylase-like protein [Microvirga lotononidis]WQO27929.1 lytic transglycosylase domain-containing protein [Microvirga lotononidis]
MTWQRDLRTVAAVIISLATLGLAPQARAENTLISPQDAEELVRAQIEEQKAAEAALKEEQAAIEAEEAAEAAKAAKSGKAAKGDAKKAKEAAKAAKVSEAPPVVAAKAAADEEEAGVEETSALPVDLSGLSRSGRADAAKASALKPLIARYASENGLPYQLADAVVRLESRYNAGARNGAHLGLTQINVRTAQSLGYQGPAAGLLDAETNLRYGLKYLARAYKLAGGDTCGTILRYQFGHRTTTMTSASRAYCAKVKVLTAAAE